MNKRRVTWPFGNPKSAAWELASPAGQLIVRRNHALVRSGARWCQGWDVWLGGQFVGAVSSRTSAELAALPREQLLAAARPACCGRHQEFQTETPSRASTKRGGRRPNAGRKPKGEVRRVQFGTTVERRTLEVIDERRGQLSRGEYLDSLVLRL